MVRVLALGVKEKPQMEEIVYDFPTASVVKNISPFSRHRLSKNRRAETCPKGAEGEQMGPKSGWKAGEKGYQLQIVAGRGERPGGEERKGRNRFSSIRQFPVKARGCLVFPDWTVLAPGGVTMLML
ncbi:hypothetical protein FA13DRAFT_1738935 [Coprinellus micaceus]|uniref:Uncharacterized protein n=1 Tax=Coprinellus micaceus TaxID=71717 RepID=A0A4Y7SSD0_COPMI|nr:hypothetical protein FA13DRAFT_1738935 [Coprinellus micaceus]